MANMTRWLHMPVMSSQKQRGSGRRMIENFGPLSGQSDILGTTYTNSHLLSSLIISLSWDCARCPLTVTGEGDVLVGHWRLTLLNGQWFTGPVRVMVMQMHHIGK